MGMIPHRICLFAALLGLGACTIVERTDRDGEEEADGGTGLGREVLEVPGVRPSRDFSPAVRSGDLLLLSGQIGALLGVDPPEVVEGGIGPQTRQAMENIGTILAAADAGFEDVLRCTVFLSDIEDHDAVSQVYREYFASTPPARSVLAVSGLAWEALVEIECIAVLR